MFHKYLTSRILPIGVCGAAIVLSASPARSERLSDERACITAFRKAKEHETSGKLQEAKDLLMSCAQAPCGSFLRQQCSSKYNQLESDTPSVVLIVTDPSGAPRADVQVRMDGEVFTQQLDGRALTVDPGMHEFTFAADGVVFATQKIMIVQGQRNRFITALVRSGGGKQRRMVAQPEKPAPMNSPANAPAKKGLKPEPQQEEATPAATPAAVASLADTGPGVDTSKASEGKKRGSVMPYLLGGVGLASIGTGALLTYWGRKDNQNLSACSPMCDPSAPNHIKRLYLGSDIALGAGVALLGAAYWVYVVTHSNKEEKGTEEALRFDVMPTTSGGFAAVSGNF
jgi:hypothetical protein